jgi:hypothetical protein
MIKQQKRKSGYKAQKRTNRKNIYVSLAVASFLVAAICAFLFINSKHDIIPTENNTSVKEASENKTEEVPVASIMEDDPRLVLDKARLRIEFKDNKNIVRVVIDKAAGKNGKEIMYKYEWAINGQSVGNSGDSISGFKRGDKVAARITLFDGDKVWLSRNIAMEIGNTIPVVIENRASSFDGKTFSTQIKANDPDGDALSYELSSGPEGMTIDKNSGIVNWLPRENVNGGDYPVKVKVSDDHGGETTYQFTVAIPKKPS